MNRRTLLALVMLVGIVLVGLRTADLRTIASEHGIRAALVYTPGELEDPASPRAAYVQSFKENGIPVDWIASTDISLFGASTLHRLYAAMVFPDGMNRRISEGAIVELRRYAADGGMVVVVNDAGTRSEDGSYRPASLFNAVSGVNALMYQSLRADAFARGPLHFDDAADARRWNVPPGKLVRSDLSSYIYGPLAYPFPRAELTSSDVNVDASNGTTPLITRRAIGAGEASYIALPIGYLREHSDAFPMTFLPSLLTARGTLPHLVASPDGIGELVIDIHIDSSNEYLGIPNMRRHNLLRHDVRMEFDVTAGPDLQNTNDGLGFDACGLGRPFLETIMPYGRIGSHGGWAHNWFARNLDENRFSFSQIRTLVDKNDKCLESITHVPVDSYAAPVGVHPQPEMTQVLDSLNIGSYYYTGDTGAPVERPFYNGKLVSDKAWAFPIIPDGLDASIAEMRRAHVPPNAVGQWLEHTASYAGNRHGIYLLYSHSYDLLAQQYATAFGGFLDHVEKLQRAGKLHATDMPAAADFMNRFVTTTSSFSRDAAGVHVSLHNPAGLRTIAFALPAAWIAPDAPLPAGIRKTSSDGGYTIYAVDSDTHDLDATFSGRT
jgi:hypothetical protein